MNKGTIQTVGNMFTLSAGDDTGSKTQCLSYDAKNRPASFRDVSTGTLPRAHVGSAFPRRSSGGADRDERQVVRRLVPVAERLEFADDGGVDVFRGKRVRRSEHGFQPRGAEFFAA